MSTPFTTYSFPLSSVLANATANRTYPTRATDVLNVKDFGAVGDGVQDDTLAIQNTFDAAFGTWASPHGQDNNTPASHQFLNKAVYFPAGYYNVSSAITRTVTNTADNGGNVQLTLAAPGTTSLSVGDYIRVYNVNGTTEVNGSWRILTIDSGTTLTVNCPFVHAFVASPSAAAVTPALRIRQCAGGVFLGDGGSAVYIRNSVAGGVTMQFDGLQNCYFQGIGFAAVTNGIAFDYNWSQTGGDTVNCSQNNFMGCAFSGGDYGIAIGIALKQAEDAYFYGCTWQGCAVAGLYVGNQNALGNVVIGGNIQNCNNYGIYVAGGSCPIISGTAFQNNPGGGGANVFDIFCNTGANDGYLISGCRSESRNFLQLAGSDICYNLSGNAHVSSSGSFLTTLAECSVNVENCTSVAGDIAGNPYLVIMNSKFSTTTYLDNATYNPTYQLIIPERITTQTSTTYQLKGSDMGTRIQCTNASATNIIVPKNSDNTWRATQGAWVEIQQYGAGQLTVSSTNGVTLRAPNSRVKTTAQYSIIRVTVDANGTDTYTIDGDGSSV